MLLPWCVSSTVPLHYMSRALSTTMQQHEDVPATTTVSKPEGSPAPGPSSSPTHPPGTLPLPVSSLLDISFVGTLPVGHPFAGFCAVPTQKKQDCSPCSSLSDHHNKRMHVDSQETRLGVNTTLHRVMRTYSNWYQKLDPALTNNKGRNLPVPISSPTRAVADPDNGTVAASSSSTVIRPHLTQTHPGRMWPTLIWTQILGTASLAQTQM